MTKHPDITIWKKGVGLIRMNDGTHLYCGNIINGVRHFLLTYYQKVYDPEPIKIQPDDIVVDIGAWAGIFMVYAATKAKQVFASEPLPQMHEFCALNIKENKLDNVVLSQLGIAGKDCERTFHFLPGDPEMGYLYDSDGHTRFTGTMGIQVVSLDRFVELHNIPRIDFLKLNCEGAEGEIIPAISEELWGRIRKAAIQIHEHLSPVSGDELIEMFLNHGFAVNDPSKAPGVKARWTYFWRVDEA
jgi:FkbM family methyltransferase